MALNEDVVRPVAAIERIALAAPIIDDCDRTRQTVVHRLELDLVANREERAPAPHPSAPPLVDMGRPGPSRRSDCAVGARAFKSRSLPGCDSPQGRAAAPVRAPIARGLRPARACRATLARGPRASASFYPLALDHVLDPIEREGAIDGLGHRLGLDLHGHPAPVLDQRGHDPSGHAHRPVGRRCGA